MQQTYKSKTASINKVMLTRKTLVASLERTNQLRWKKSKRGRTKKNKCEYHSKHSLLGWVIR